MYGFVIFKLYLLCSLFYCCYSAHLQTLALAVAATAGFVLEALKNSSEVLVGRLNSFGNSLPPQLSEFL